MYVGCISLTACRDDVAKALFPEPALKTDEAEAVTTRRSNKKAKTLSVAEYGNAAYAKSGVTKAGHEWHRSDYNLTPRGTSDVLTPLQQLQEALEKHNPNARNDIGNGTNVVYWMGMRDQRMYATIALSHMLRGSLKNEGGKAGAVI
jgi:deoxyribodipyrimidine photo-lyase